MLHPVASLARHGWLPDLVDFARLLPSYYRVAFLGAGLRAGILQRLAEGPATPAELTADLGYEPSMMDGLTSWLDLGVTLRELRLTNGRYALRSLRARRLVRRSHDPLAAMYEEMCTLDHALVIETPERLKAGRWFELSDTDADVIARDSQLGEPWLEAAIEAFIPTHGAPRLLEIGCGSGAHIRTACRHNGALTGLGLELQEPAAELARTNLAAWGLDQRFEVSTGDIRERSGDGSFDLATLHQNIYYFPAETQQALFDHVGSFLRPGGRLLVTSVVRGAGLATNGLDLWGAMTSGAERLPIPDRLVEALRAAGFRDTTAEPLGVDKMYFAFSGTWQG